MKVSTEKLHAFQDHPYKVLDNKEMDELVSSIQQNGILSPILVRPLDHTTDEYEIISGHRRFHAAKIAGLTEIPVIVYNISHDKAAIMLVDSNLHRENILPSEKAYAYKMKADAIKRQGYRTDLTMGQIVPKSDDNRSLSLIGAQTGESYKTIQRYIRLTNLIPELLDLMDQGIIAFSVGYELSFLSERFQRILLDEITKNDCTPSYSQASRMHKAMSNNLLSIQLIQEIMSELKANQKEMIRIPMSRLYNIIPKNYNTKQTETFIIHAVEHYVQFLNSHN